ncbi:MAG: type II secretion system F family protein, partial [Bryobacteraceae bacterium]
RVAGDLTEAPRPHTVVTFLQTVGSRMPSSEQDVATLKASLIRAGFRSETAVPVFYGVRIITTLAMVLTSFLLLARMPSNPSMKVMLLMSGAMAGWILPKFFLEKKVKKRQTILRLSLPDALDMMVVSVEAGLGLDQAIQHVARELALAHPQLSEEMMLVTLEMRAGKRRADALRNFAERTGEPEVRKLVAILVQNDRFGTSMGESLRNHSDFMRTRRRQEAEERAGKVGVKLVFPIFFCILPSILIVAAGPALLQIFKYLFPMMNQVH